MLSKCRAIVIKCIDYSETSVILKCYTDLYGMQSYLINGVRKNKGSIRPSQLLPLTLLELEAYHQQNKNLQRIKELKCAPQLGQLHFDMVKSAVAMFMGEVVYRSIKEENQPDAGLFEFLYHAIQLVDEEQGRLTNFPVYYLLQLSRLLGFYPRYNHQGTGAFAFNFKEGEFEFYNDKDPFQFDLATSELLLHCMESDYLTTQQLHLHAHHRRQLINGLIQYYNQHLNGFSNMRSHEILAEVLE